MSHTTIDQLLDRVRAFDFDRLEIRRGQPMHVRALTLIDMAIDEIESIIAGEPFIEATRQKISTIIDSPSTPLPDSVLRIDNMIMLREDGSQYYNIDIESDPILEPWTGINRGRPVGCFIEGENIFWDPPHPAIVFDIMLTGYFSVANIPVDPQTEQVDTATTFPLHDAYVNACAAMVAQLFEKSRGEDMKDIRDLARSILGPVINMRRRRTRAPTAGRFKWVNN